NPVCAQSSAGCKLGFFVVIRPTELSRRAGTRACELTLQQAQRVAAEERAGRKLRRTLSGWPGQRREGARNRRKGDSEPDWYRREHDQDLDGEVSLGGIGACNDSATTIDASYHRTLYPDK
ncbi:hypothetical protein GBAR_LOCUS2091, partial [Geodia barretti]